MTFRITDIALLIQGHEFRRQGYEEAVYDVLDKAATNLRDDQRAHVYAYVVEKSNPHFDLASLEAVLKSALKGMPQ